MSPNRQPPASVAAASWAPAGASRPAAKTRARKAVPSGLAGDRLGAGLLPARSVQDSKVWADPVIGLRGSVEVGRGFLLAGAADIGGFGIASDFTWQILGILGYRFNAWFSARAGYRHLEVDYESDGFVWDVQMNGPILGATFRF